QSSILDQIICVKGSGGWGPPTRVGPGAAGGQSGRARRSGGGSAGGPADGVAEGDDAPGQLLLLRMAEGEPEVALAGLLAVRPHEPLPRPEGHAVLHGVGLGLLPVDAVG